MNRACTSHHHACDCREHAFAVLNKAALDCAGELDVLKGAVHRGHITTIDDEEADRLQDVTERVYGACDALLPRKMTGCKRADGGADCNYNECDRCSSAIWTLQVPVEVDGKTLEPITLTLAKIVAAGSACLDDLSSGTLTGEAVIEETRAARRLSAQLAAIARMLAGSRANEIYNAEEAAAQPEQVAA